MIVGCVTLFVSFYSSSCFRFLEPRRPRRFPGRWRSSPILRQSRCWSPDSRSGSFHFGCAISTILSSRRMGGCLPWGTTEMCINCMIGIPTGCLRPRRFSMTTRATRFRRASAWRGGLPGRAGLMNRAGGCILRAGARFFFCATRATGRVSWNTSPVGGIRRQSREAPVWTRSGSLWIAMGISILR